MGRILSIAALLFGSGMCALVYQTVWLRSLRLIFGSSTPATGAVLAIFMGGLGLGALRLGRNAQASANPLRLYALLEAGISIAAAITPFLLYGVGSLYIAAGGAQLGGPASTAVRLLLATCVIGVPVFLMGGTLPAAGRAVTGATDLGRKGLALLYGVNTLGAVAGALLSTFVMFEAFGTRTTLWLACALNVGVVLLALKMSKSVGTPAAAEAPPEPPDGSTPAATPRSGLLLTAAGVSGFSFLLAELVWYRMAAPILGGSTYTFGLVLAVALLGVGLGGVLYSWLGPSRPTEGRFALTCALMTVTLLAPLALGDDLALLAHHLREAGQRSFPMMVLGWSVVTAILVLPTALVAGYQFPLLLALKGRGTENVATDVGQLYGANTLGAILGSLAGGFGLLPMLGAPGAWTLAALLFVPVTLAFAHHAWPRERGRVIGALVVAALGLLLLLAPGPSAIWRHTAIGAGRAGLSQPSWNAQREALNAKQRWIFGETEGRESSLGFGSDGLTLVVNGKSDGSATKDASTMILLALIGAILHPDPESAFVIGLGTGQTAGWSAAVPTMKRVDCVELEPEVAEFARLCRLTNFDVMDHPKVTHVFGDGREALQVARHEYDLIASEPSNPFRAGLASFYTTDFYRHAKDRLGENGLFLQWLQSYEVDTTTVQIVVTTLRSVFPYVSVWMVNPRGDLLLVGSAEPQVISVDQVRERLHSEPYRTAFGRIAGIHDVEGFLALHLANPKLADSFLAVADDSVINTDDRTLLEYRFARSVGKPNRVSPLDVLQAAYEVGAHSPAIRGESTVDGARVQLLRVRPWQAAEMTLPQIAVDEADADRMAMWSAASSGDVGGAMQLMQTLPPPPAHDVFERMLWARIRLWGQGQRKSTLEEREALADELELLESQGFATDAAWLRLQARTLDGLDDTILVEQARAAFEATRRDPWVRQGLVATTLANLAAGLEDRETASAVARALLEAPFAVEMAETYRRYTAAQLAFRAGDFQTAARAFELDEPHPRWARADLEARALTYQQARPRLAEQAHADLAEFLAHDTPPLVELLKRR